MPRRLTFRETPASTYGPGHDPDGLYGTWHVADVAGPLIGRHVVTTRDEAGCVTVIVDSSWR